MRRWTLHPRYFDAKGLVAAWREALLAQKVLAGGTAKLTVDQRKETTPVIFVRFGEFTFKAGDPGFVEVSTGSADGRVAIDGVRWVWLGNSL